MNFRILSISNLFPGIVFVCFVLVVTRIMSGASALKGANHHFKDIFDSSIFVNFYNSMKFNNLVAKNENYFSKIIFCLLQLNS